MEIESARWESPHSRRGDDARLPRTAAGRPRRHGTSTAASCSSPPARRSPWTSSRRGSAAGPAPARRVRRRRRRAARRAHPRPPPQDHPRGLRVRDTGAASGEAREPVPGLPRLRVHIPLRPREADGSSWESTSFPRCSPASAAATASTGTASTGPRRRAARLRRRAPRAEPADRRRRLRDPHDRSPALSAQPRGQTGGSAASGGGPASSSSTCSARRNVASACSRCRRPPSGRRGPARVRALIMWKTTPVWRAWSKCSRLRTAMSNRSSIAEAAQQLATRGGRWRRGASRVRSAR